MLFCRMKMSLSQHPSLSNHCAPLKEKVAGEEENEKKKKKTFYVDILQTF